MYQIVNLYSHMPVNLNNNMYKSQSEAAIMTAWNETISQLDDTMCIVAQWVYGRKYFVKAQVIRLSHVHIWLYKLSEYMCTICQ